MTNPTTTQNQRSHPTTRPIQRPGRPASTTGQSTELSSLLRECSDACYAAFNHCVNEGENLIEANHLKVMLDCADVCITGANFIARESTYVQEFQSFAAPIVKACEESCEQFPNEALVTACADMCRETYGSLTGSPQSGSKGNQNATAGGNVGEEE